MDYESEECTLRVDTYTLDQIEIRIFRIHYPCIFLLKDSKKVYWPSGVRCEGTATILIYKHCQASISFNTQKWLFMNGNGSLASVRCLKEMHNACF